MVAQFPPMGGGGVIRISTFVRHLVGMGWSIAVITADTDAVLAYTGAPRDDGLGEDLLRRGVQVMTTPLPLWPTPPPAIALPDRGPWRLPVRLWRRLRYELWHIRSRLVAPMVIDPFLPWGGRALERAEALAEDGYRPDVVLATSPPHSVLWTASRIANLLGAPLVVDLRDQWVGNPHPSIDGCGLRGRLVNRWMERKVMRQACAIVTPTEESTKVLMDRYPALASRASTIPNGYDGERWKGIEETPREGLLTLAYVGTLYRPRDIAPLLSALLAAIARRPDLVPVLRLRVVGPIEDGYRTAFQEALGDGFESTGAVSQERALHEMARADWLLAVLHSGEGASSAIPGKLYEYMAARRPVLALVSEGAAATMVRENRLGLVADPLDVEAMADAILRIYDNWRTDEPWPLPSEDLLRRYDRRCEAEELHRVLARCATESAAHRSATDGAGQ